MDKQVEKKTLDNAIILDSKPEKPVPFNTTLNAEEIFEELGGHVGGWTKWHIFMFKFCVHSVLFTLDYTLQLSSSSVSSIQIFLLF